MKAIILCGGYGTRLGELTKDTPKPLIKVGNKSVLQTIIDRLKDAGIKEIVIKVHYLPDKIIQEIGEQALYYFEPILFDQDESMRKLKGWIGEEDYMLINGDTLSNVDYKKMMASHQEGTISVLLDSWRCAGTWIYCHQWFNNTEIPVRPYRQAGLKWADIGLPDRLEDARKVFA
jgi:D-glycero-alpha-D-manno-heptose 1-phosphate guanylyltransferase